MASDQDHGHQGDEHHPELGLDQGGGDAQERGTLTVAPDQRRYAQEHHEGARRVGLTPQGGP